MLNGLEIVQIFVCLRIVIIDDSRAFAAGLKRILEDQGCVIEVYNECAKALEGMRQVQPDIIVSDLEMPEMNGLDFVRLLRQEKEFMDIPILVLSGTETAENMVAAVAAGADGFAGKSTVQNTFKAQLLALARLRQAYVRATRAKQLDSVKALIGTYKHEFGNVLAILDGKLRKLERTVPAVAEDESYQGVRNCYGRLVDTLKKLDSIRRYEESGYSGDTKIVKIG